MFYVDSITLRVLKFEIRKFESSNNLENKFEFDRQTPKPSYSNIYIGAELGGAAGACAPPVLHNPRKFIV